MFLKILDAPIEKQFVSKNIEMYKKDCNKNVIKNYLTKNKRIYKMYNVNARYKT